MREHKRPPLIQDKEAPSADAGEGGASSVLEVWVFRDRKIALKLNYFQQIAQNGSILLKLKK